MGHGASEDNVLMIENDFVQSYECHVRQVGAVHHDRRRITDTQRNKQRRKFTSPKGHQSEQQAPGLSLAIGLGIETNCIFGYGKPKPDQIQTKAEGFLTLVTSHPKSSKYTTEQ